MRPQQDFQPPAQRGVAGTGLVQESRLLVWGLLSNEVE